MHNQRNNDFAFQVNPKEFTKNSDKDFLAYCLGATQYMPGTRIISKKIIDRTNKDLNSIVMCLEDAIKDGDVESAEHNIRLELENVTNAVKEKVLSENDIPLIFIRIRNPEHLKHFLHDLNDVQLFSLTGFVFPKFNSLNALHYLDILTDFNNNKNCKLYAMPILEGVSIAYSESRIEELLKIKNILQSYSSIILNVRIGGTDLSSLFGFRRSIDKTIYEILPISEIITDIINILGRSVNNFLISGPVWEYFRAYKKDDISKLKVKNLKHSILNQAPIFNVAVDGLIREIRQDKIHGMVGKTVIHPSHIKYVNTLQAITLEEYVDAKQILESSGGVEKSFFGNKMNEVNPHKNWAKRVMKLSEAYGVVADENQYIELLIENKV
jgi:citrate lyase beta subunit